MFIYVEVFIDGLFPHTQPWVKAEVRVVDPGLLMGGLSLRMAGPLEDREGLPDDHLTMTVSPLHKPRAIEGN